MTEIISQLPTEMECYEYALGMKLRDINAAYQFLRDSGAAILSPRITLACGLYIFYRSADKQLSHISLVDKTSLLTSKFARDPNVYRHEIWGKPIPRTFYYDEYFILSSVPKID